VTKNVHICSMCIETNCRQTGSRNLKGPKTLPTIWYTYMMGRDLIFGHKLHIGTPYRGKRFCTHQTPTSCLPTLLIFIHIEHMCTFFVGHTYMKLVTNYQIPAINSCLEKCDEKCAYIQCV
jgi:hypothetical protein